MFISYVTLDDVSVHEAAEFDAVALLADTWDNDLDPEVSVQLLHANVQAYFSFGKENGKGKGKGKFPVRSSRLPLNDGRQQLRELAVEKDFEHRITNAHFPSVYFRNHQTRAARLMTQLHFSSQPRKVTTFLFSMIATMTQKLSAMTTSHGRTVNSTPKNTARAELHSMITVHHANARGSSWKAHTFVS